MISIRRPRTYAQKVAETHREAKASVIAVAVIVVAWIALGFGLAGSSATVFSTPIWVIGGTVGVWIVALICCFVLARFVFVDFDLDKDEIIPDENPDAAPKGQSEEGGEDE